MTNSEPSVVPNKVPIVTILYVLLNVILYYLVDNSSHLVTPAQIIFEPSWVHFGQAILANFLHINFNHLAGNMLFITFAGYAVERKYGHLKFIGVLVLSLISNLLFTVLFLPQDGQFLGASGVVSGVCVLFALSI